MEDLPAELTIDILSRLPVKTIIHCKFVCKKWRNLVSDSSFVHLHLSRSPTGLTLHNKPDRSKYESIDPGILKWLEIEENVDHHHLNHDPLMSLDLNRAPILQNSRIFQMGSVNGLICLCQSYSKLDNTYLCNPITRELDYIYICNPITREYMILPRPKFKSIVYGFGVGSLTRQYKVILIFQGDIDIPPGPYSSSRPRLLEAEVYTLGSSQWKSLGPVAYRLHGLDQPFLNGHCHWIVCDEDAPEKLCSFDFDKETFQLFPSPPTEAIESRMHYQSLAVVRGFLCKLDSYDFQFTIWVMKEYGIKKSWHKEVVIERGISSFVTWMKMIPVCLIEGLKDGSILMVSSRGKLLALKDRFEDIKILDTECLGRCTSVLTYRPSFLKLQNFDSERVHMF